MVENNEVIALVLSLGVFLFMLVYRRELRRIPCGGMLLAGYVCLCLGMIFTVAEGLIWFNVLNLLEHLANVAGACLLVAWLWRISRRRGKSLWTP